MNLLEAVQKLLDGECRQIKSCTGETHAFIHAQKDLMVSCAEIIGGWELVDPTPKMEKVEVYLWWCRSCLATQNYEGSGECCNRPLVKLSGYDTVPVKKQVKRRMLIGLAAKTLAYFQAHAAPPDAQIYAEWLEEEGK